MKRVLVSVLPKLAPYLDPELKKFYISLLRSEARHYQDYLTLAERSREQRTSASVFTLLLEQKKQS